MSKQQGESPASINDDDKQKNDDSVVSNNIPENSTNSKEQDKKVLRKQRKETVKAQKRERRAKREGEAPELGRKPCDLCKREVDLLIRCTIDESQYFKMVCGKCWPDVSGGVPDGSLNHPHYTYGGLWKNRNANLKKRVGSGPSGSKNIPSTSDELACQI